MAYVVDDAQQLAGFETATFDGATCQLALVDIPDLDATLAAIRRVLRQDGWFVFVIGHPCFLAPDAVVTERPDGRAAVAVSGYFDERFWRSSNPHGVRRAGNHHRTLSSYLNALIRNGFTLEQVDEPAAGPPLARATSPRGGSDLLRWPGQTAELTPSALLPALGVRCSEPISRPAQT